MDPAERIIRATIETVAENGYPATTVAAIVSRAKEWPVAVRSAYEAMFAYFAAEPAFARMAMVEIYAAGAVSMDRRDRMIEGLQRLLAPGYEHSPNASPVAAEAIGGAAYALVSDQIRRQGPESLPEIVPQATYLTLAPFLGASEACEAANSAGRGSR